MQLYSKMSTATESVYCIWQCVKPFYPKLHLALDGGYCQQVYWLCVRELRYVTLAEPYFWRQGPPEGVGVSSTIPLWFPDDQSQSSVRDPNHANILRRTYGEWPFSISFLPRNVRTASLNGGPDPNKWVNFPGTHKRHLHHLDSRVPAIVKMAVESGGEPETPAYVSSTLDYMKYHIVEARVRGYTM